MSRTTISRTIEAAVLLGAVLAGGCSQKYGHERLGTDSPEAAKVRKMLQALRDAGEGGLDDVLRKDGADGLTEAKARMLRGTLLEMVRADSVQLKQMDRFGKDVWRAIFELTAAGKTSTVPVLLVITDDDQVRWAGRN